LPVINGSSAADFIHRLGDGFLPGGLNEIATVSAGADTISGLAGHDVIFGDGGSDLVTGDDGNDTLHGGQGTDRLYGGVGNDVFRIIGVSDVSGLAETISGGNDVDTIDFQALNAAGAVNLSRAVISGIEQLALFSNDVTLTSAQLGAFSAIVGSGFTERLILSNSGTVDLTGAWISAIEEIRGNSGANNVVLTGVANGQTVNVLSGNDTVLGGDGNDVLDGGADNDSLSGALGNDTLIGGSGADTIQGNDGNDVLIGGSGLDVLSGEAGNDTFRINLISDISGLAETVDGGEDIDTLDFQTVQNAGSANISLAVLTSLETLLLGATELTLTATQLGAFTTIGGTGFTERVILSGAGTADLNGATIFSIEEIRGSSGADTIRLVGVATGQFVDGRGGNDTLQGSLANDVLFGDDDNDLISGFAGADILRGGQGVDRVYGGIGNDTIQIAGISDISGLAEIVDGGNDVDTLDFVSLGAIGAVNLTTTTLVGIEILRISQNTVTLTAAQMGSFEEISGTGFFERIVLSAAGTVDLTGTTITGIDEFTGTSGADRFLFSGATGGMTVNGLSGSDSLVGGDSGNTLLGGIGNDTLIGGGGSDLIVGGQGTDLLTGGLGVDRFDFNDASEMGLAALRDVITDFVHGQDIIDLSDIDADTNTPGSQNFSFITTAFTGVAGQVRYAGGVLQIDLDGVGGANLEIALTGSPVVTASDLLL